MSMEAAPSRLPSKPSIWNCNQKKKKMPLHDRLLLNPFEKYRKYGRFPWKFLFHVFLLAAVTAQTVLITNQNTPYSRAAVRTLYTFFMSSQDDYSGKDYDRTVNLYSIQDFVDSINSTVWNYYHINDLSVQKFQYYYQDSGVVKPITLRVTKFVVDGGGKMVEQVESYELESDDDLKPLDGDVKAFIQNMKSCTLSLSLKDWIQTPALTACYQWEITPTYDFSHGGHVSLTLGTQRYRCDESDAIVFGNLFWLHLLVLCLAIISQLLSWRAIFQSAIIYRHVKKKHGARNSKSRRDTTAYQPPDLSSGRQSPMLGAQASRFSTGVNGQGTTSPASPPNESNVSRGLSTVSFRGMTQDTVVPWDKLSWRDKIQFFNLWFIITIIGNVCQFSGSILCMAPSISPSLREVLVGIGCMMAWLNMIRYLEYFEQYYILILTIRNGFPTVLRFMVGVIPLFLGYTFLGLAIFWESYRFSDTSQAMISLFSVLNGDMIHDTFEDLGFIRAIWAQLYVYSFICIFIYVVLNIFISIIQDSFFTTKEAKKKMVAMHNAQADTQHVLSPVSTTMPRKNSFMESNDLPLRTISSSSGLFGPPPDANIPRPNEDLFSNGDRTVQQTHDDYVALRSSSSALLFLLREDAANAGTGSILDSFEESEKPLNGHSDHSGGRASPSSFLDEDQSAAGVGSLPNSRSHLDAARVPLLVSTVSTDSNGNGNGNGVPAKKKQLSSQQLEEIDQKLAQLDNISEEIRTLLSLAKSLLPECYHPQYQCPCQNPTCTYCRVYLRYEDMLLDTQTHVKLQLRSKDLVTDV